MKKTLIALSLLLFLASCKMSNVPHREAVAYEIQYAPFAQPTPKRDTLYLLVNDPISLTIKNIWSADSIKVKPEIIMVTNEEMLCIKKRCNGQSDSN